MGITIATDVYLGGGGWLLWEKLLWSTTSNICNYVILSLCFSTESCVYLSHAEVIDAAIEVCEQCVVMKAADSTFVRYIGQLESLHAFTL